MTQQDIDLLLELSFIGVVMYIFIAILLYAILRATRTKYPATGSDIKTWETQTQPPLIAQVFIASNLEELEQAENLGLNQVEIKIETTSVYLGQAFFKNVLWWWPATQPDETKLIMVQLIDEQGEYSFKHSSRLQKALLAITTRSVENI